MPRVVKTAAARQDEILDAAQRLFMTRGYEDTSIQAIIDEVGIAKGTFYHHYPSKPALLDALVARMVVLSLALVAPVVEDPSLGAIDKLNLVFQRIGAWKNNRRALLTEMYRAMNSEANAPMQSRIERDSVAAMVPIIERIIEQGVAESAFDTRFPREAARILMDMMLALGHLLGAAVISGDSPELDGLAQEIDAYHDAVGRLLGAPADAILLVDVALITVWFAPAETETPSQQSSDTPTQNATSGLP